MSPELFYQNYSEFWRETHLYTLPHVLSEEFNFQHQTTRDGGFTEHLLKSSTSQGHCNVNILHTGIFSLNLDV